MITKIINLNYEYYWPLQSRFLDTPLAPGDDTYKSAEVHYMQNFAEHRSE